jgi:uncharacterized OB-fold protein
VPTPTNISRQFWEGCAHGKLLFQRCMSCQSPVFNPAIVCRSCGSTNLSWEESDGLGSIYSWTVVWRAQTIDFRVPYAPAIVTLDEGYHMLSSIIECDTRDLKIGLRVEVDFNEVGEGIWLPYFRPARDSSRAARS